MAWSLARSKILFESKSQGINESANFRFLQRLSVIFDFSRDCLWSLASCQDYHPRKMASCRDCPCDSASCRESQQEAEPHRQSLQEAISQAQLSRQEARDHGQSWGKPNMTDSLFRKRILADLFIPCVNDPSLYRALVSNTPSSWNDSISVERMSKSQVIHPFCCGLASYTVYHCCHGCCMQVFMNAPVWSMCESTPAFHLIMDYVN